MHFQQVYRHPLYIWLLFGVTYIRKIADLALHNQFAVRVNSI